MLSLVCTHSIFQYCYRRNVGTDKGLLIGSSSDYDWTYPAPVPVKKAASEPPQGIYPKRRCSRRSTNKLMVRHGYAAIKPTRFSSNTVKGFRDSRVYLDSFVHCPLSLAVCRDESRKPHLSSAYFAMLRACTKLLVNIRWESSDGRHNPFQYSLTSFLITTIQAYLIEPGLRAIRVFRCVSPFKSSCCGCWLRRKHEASVVTQDVD